MSFKTLPKDPDAELDYGFDWGDESNWMATGDIISASDWTVPAGLTEVTDAFTDTRTLVWLSGGTAGEIYLITNSIETADGREDDRSMYIKVDER